MNNNNGFAEALNRINTLMDVGQDVEMDALTKAAKYFANKLRKNIKASDKSKQKHMRDSLKVVVKNDMVSVIFEDTAWYWYLAEHGHKKAGGKGRVKGLHFVRNTIDTEKSELERIMLNQILNELGG